MEYTKFGKTDLNISKLCLGTMGFGASNEWKLWQRNIENSQHLKVMIPLKVS